MAQPIATLSGVGRHARLTRIFAWKWRSLRGERRFAAARARAFGIALGACAGACAGTPARPPPAPQLNVPLRQVQVQTAPVEREALAAIPGIDPDRVEVAAAWPSTLDLGRDNPILITQVTADRARSNVAELDAYASAALEEGYVVLTAQSVPWPARAEHDTLLLRYATVRAALRWLATELPASERWPIVLAGFSGGAKIIQVLAVSASLEQRRVAGLFLGGCNEEHFSLLLAQYPSMKEPLSRMAFYLSAGEDDRIAPPASMRTVAEQLRHAGVRRVELSVHRGEHRLDQQDLRRALRWFWSQDPALASGR